MTTITGARPHPIFLAGRWVDSPDPLVVDNPADPASPAGSTYHATEAQYEEAVEAAVAAFEVTRILPAYERGRDPARDQRRDQGPPRGARPADRAGGRQADPRRAGRGRSRGPHLPARRRGGRADGRRGDPARPDGLVARAGSASPGASRSARSPRISPFNFPLNLAAHKIAPAIAAGLLDRAQAAVQGPADDAHRRRDHRGGRAARPASVSILPMTRELGDRMVADDAVQAPHLHRQPVGRLADEGAGRQEEGRPRARRQRRRSSSTRPPTSTGRSSGCLVGALRATPARSCISVQRMFVHEDVWDAFMERFVAGARALKVGDPLDADDRRRADGRRGRRVADPALGRRGRRARRQGPARRPRRRDTFFPPTILDRRAGRRPRSAPTRRSRRSSWPSRSATSTTRSARSTTRSSGSRPASSRTTWHTPGRRSTSSRSAASSSTTCPTYRIDHMPYGGVKDSGLGREGLRWAIEDMTELRIMVLAQPQ